MQTILQAEEEAGTTALGAQTLSLCVHAGLALVAWLALIFAGYALNPEGIPQSVILMLSMLVPLVAGNLVNRFRQEEMATLVWLLGLIWALSFSLWILDLPTGPNACFQCGASEKLLRTFFSIPTPSGLIDNDGPFLGAWPAAALFGYSIGARLALRQRPQSEQ